jgi:hypothetical protein
MIFQIKGYKSGLYIHKWIYTANNYNRAPRLKPRTEVQKQTRKNNHYEKEKEDYASNLFADQTPNAQDVKAPQAAKVHDL